MVCFPHNISGGGIHMGETARWKQYYYNRSKTEYANKKEIRGWSECEVGMVSMLFEENQMKKGGNFHLYQKLEDPHKESDYVKNVSDLRIQLASAQE